jgi:anti-anti-sigma factor
MENKIFDKNAKNGIYFSNQFFASRKVYKFRSIYDTSDNNTIVIAEIERATVYEAKEFYEYVNNLLDQNKCKIIIDLENIYFMDSVFFGTLIKLLKKADKMNGYIKLIVDYNSKPELLSISNFEGIFEIFPNLFEAVNHNKAN